MARSGNQKRKILYLERMMEETGEERPLTMREMIEKLAETGIQAERKSIYDDLEELRAVGMEIIFRKASPAGYYWKRETEAEEKHIDGEDETKAGVQEPGAGEAGLQEPGAGEGEAGAQEPGEVEQEAVHRERAYREVQLRLRKGGLEPARRRYGENLKILKQEGKQILAAAPEIPGPEFYGWLTGQGGGIKLLKPKDAVKEYRKLLKKVLEAYK